MSDNSETTSNIDETTSVQLEEEVAEEASEEPEPPEEEPKPKRKPGRPAGSKDIAPRKRRAKVTQVKVEQEPESAEEPAEPEQPELPRVLPQSRPIPEKAYDATSARMLELLHQQTHARKQRKVDLWKSWFV